MNARKGEVPTMISVMRVAVFLLLVPMTLVGCGTYQWTEEVQLSDGRVITVERKQKYGGAGGIGNSCWYCRLEKAEMRFEIDGKEYEWKSSTYAVRPMILDVEDGAPVLVTQPGNWGLCARDPDNYDRYYYYIYNVWSGKDWDQRDQFDKPIANTVNLLRDRPKNRHIPLEDKRSSSYGDVKNYEYKVIEEYDTYSKDDFKFVPRGCRTWTRSGDWDIKKVQKERLRTESHLN